MELNFDEMMELCNSKEEFRAKEEFVDGVSVTIFSYMVAFSNTFDSELAKEFRGTTFLTESKECISRPFSKFFNIGEKEDTQKDKINWRNAKFYTKHDGSMATPVLINDKVHWKTKKSFFSDVAINVQKHYEHCGHKLFYDRLDIMRKLKHHTPIFEYVGPSNRIVLDYKREELIYLGFRDIRDGEFFPYEETEVKDVQYENIFAMKGIEGFVIHDGNQIVKAKCEEYLTNHKIVSEFNPKAIIRATLDENIDDILGVVSQLGMTDRFDEISKLRDETLAMKIELNQQINMAWGIVGFYQDDRKEFALKVNSVLDNTFKSFMFLILDDKSYLDKLDEFVYNTVYKNYKPTSGD